MNCFDQTPFADSIRIVEQNKGPPIWRAFVLGIAILVVAVALVAITLSVRRYAAPHAG
jgi:hypothetical protein